VEKITFVNFAAHGMDDGEAATSAIALHRNWAVATDDRRCRSLLSQKASHLQLLSTPEFIKHWVENASPDLQLVRSTLQNIEARANYLVGRREPLYKWWQEQKL
jgi:hypothetical protein